jgi:hypothetical protein
MTIGRFVSRIMTLRVRDQTPVRLSLRIAEPTPDGEVFISQHCKSIYVSAFSRYKCSKPCFPAIRSFHGAPQYGACLPKEVLELLGKSPTVSVSGARALAQNNKITVEAILMAKSLYTKQTTLARFVLELLCPPVVHIYATEYASSSRR